MYKTYTKNKAEYNTTYRGGKIPSIPSHISIFFFFTPTSLVGGGCIVENNLLELIVLIGSLVVTLLKLITKLKE